MPTENNAAFDPALLGILQHSLGVDEYGQGNQYRNHYVAGGIDVERCRQLVDLGYMKERPASAISGGDPWFSVTAAGVGAVAVLSPPAPPPKKRTQWDEYLDRDSCDRFGEWLLGGMKPEFEHRGSWKNREYRMYRCRYSSMHSEVRGEWCRTMKDAKASYKAALKTNRDELKAYRAGAAA